jgi:hypothetical protein
MASVDELSRTTIFGLLRAPEAKTPEEVPHHLTRSERSVIAQLRTTYGDKLSSIILMPDKSFSGLGGNVQILHASTNVDPTVSFHPEIFGITCMVPITQHLPTNTGMKYSKYIKRVLKPRLAQILSETCSSTTVIDGVPHVTEFATIRHHYGDGRDRKAWKPHWHSGSVGIYSLPLREHGDVYYLGFRCCTIGHALTKEIFDLITSCGMTAEQICTDPRIMWAKRVSARNIELMIYNIFSALEWDISAAIDDTCSFFHKHHECPRLIPIHDTQRFPNSHCVYNTFGPILDAAAKITSVKIFMGCADGDQTTGAALIHGDDESAIYEIPCADITHPSHKVKNQVFNALPFFSSEAEPLEAEMIGVNSYPSSSSSSSSSKKKYKHGKQKEHIRHYAHQKHVSNPKFKRHRHPYTDEGSHRVLRTSPQQITYVPSGVVTQPVIYNRPVPVLENPYDYYAKFGTLPPGYAGPPIKGKVLRFYAREGRFPENYIVPPEFASYYPTTPV